jgi:hypothetical protein
LGNTPTTLFSGEEGNKQPAALFVESSNQLIDPLMLFGNRTLGTASTVRTTAMMNNSCHKHTPCNGQNEGKVIVGRNGQLVFRQLRQQTTHRFAWK